TRACRTSRRLPGNDMMNRTGVLVLALGLVAGGVAAQSTSALPPGVCMGGKTWTDARAGTYTIDPDHCAVFARVQHIGYAWSVFRFDKAGGKLTWDRAAPEKSTLAVAVETGSITSNVKGFAETLASEQYLRS